MKLKTGIALIGAVVVCAILLLAASSTSPSYAASVPTLQFNCAYLKTEAIDPILDPPAGASHDHDFYGNRGVNANSTFESMSADGQTTTCRIGAATSSYWHPAFRNGGGEVQTPLAITNYYRDSGTRSPDMQPIPDGLQNIAHTGNGNVKYRCGSGSATSEPPVGCTKEWRVIFQFPNCWNPNAGKGPDSVVYAGPRGCPASHPYEFPALQMAAKFPRPADGTLHAPVEVSIGNGGWGLASEHAHADRFDADQNPEFDDNWLGPCVLDVEPTQSSPARCINARD